jgi:hypothetical protein
VVFEDEAGQSLRPPKARTWSHKGTTPIVKVTGKASGRVFRPGQPAKLVYRMLVHHGRKNEPKGFRERDLARLLNAAHQQLCGPLVLV